MESRERYNLLWVKGQIFDSSDQRDKRRETRLYCLKKQGTAVYRLLTKLPTIKK